MNQTEKCISNGEQVEVRLVHSGINAKFVGLLCLSTKSMLGEIWQKVFSRECKAYKRGRKDHQRNT